MKNIIFILGFTFLIACNSSQEKFVSASIKTDRSETNNIRIDKHDFDLNGTWGLTNYFDTIIKNRELAKYRLQTPTWFAILLEIENDSLRSYGSINNDEYIIEKSNDTLITLTSNISGDKWYMRVSEPYLILIQSPNSERIDSTIYIFRKRNDLKYFIEEKKDFYIIGNSVTEYFNDRLFKGTYINEETKKEIIFGANGQLTGINGFDSYEVRNYFGTLHMHKNLDVVTFKNKQNNESKQYNWVFSEDELLLTEFVYEQVSYKGKYYDGDYLVLGKERIRLMKMAEHNKK